MLRLGLAAHSPLSSHLLLRVSLGTLKTQGLPGGTAQAESVLPLDSEGILLVEPLL